jgi:hypothetical protein
MIQSIICPWRTKIEIFSPLAITEVSLAEVDAQGQGQGTIVASYIVSLIPSRSLLDGQNLNIRYWQA